MTIKEILRFMVHVVFIFGGGFVYGILFLFSYPVNIFFMVGSFLFVLGNIMMLTDFVNRRFRGIPAGEVKVNISDLNPVKAVIKLVADFIDPDMGLYLYPDDIKSTYICICCGKYSPMDVPDDYVPALNEDYHSKSCMIVKLRTLLGLINKEEK